MLLLATVAGALPVPAAIAAPPPNDAPGAAATFDPYTAEDGSPAERQAIAELAEAQPDPGVPRCLGRSSFARTVWFSVPGTETPRELKVEASGSTLDVVDLAAFVQPPEGGPPLTSRPNACAGVGSAGADAAADRTSGLTLRVPSWHAVFVQVGRRGPVGSPDSERAVLSLSEIPLPVLNRPGGDEAGPTTQRIGSSGRGDVTLGGATTTPDDPAVPACPSLAGVWRRVRVRRTGVWTVTVSGGHAAALSVFAGGLPDRAGFRGCVDRDGPGRLVLPVRARRRELLWIRVGADRPPEGASARLRFSRASARDVESGGGCLASPTPRVGGRLSGPATARARNRSRSVRLVVDVARGPVCAATLELVGPRRRVYARTDVPVLRGRGQRVRLTRVRRLRRGVYRLRVTAAGLGGVRVGVSSTLAFRLRQR